MRFILVFQVFFLLLFEALNRILFLELMSCCLGKIGLKLIFSGVKHSRLDFPTTFSSWNLSKVACNFFFKSGDEWQVIHPIINKTSSEALNDVDLQARAFCFGGRGVPRSFFFPVFFCFYFQLDISKFLFFLLVICFSLIFSCFSIYIIKCTSKPFDLEFRFFHVKNI